MKKKVYDAFNLLEKELCQLSIAEKQIIIGGDDPIYKVEGGYIYTSYDGGITWGVYSLPEVTVVSSSGGGGPLVGFPDANWINTQNNSSPGSFLFNNTEGGGNNSFSGGNVNTSTIGSSGWTSPKQKVGEYNYISHSSGNSTLSDLFQTMASTLGIAIDHAAIAAKVAEIEHLAKNLEKGSRFFAAMDIGGNIFEAYDDARKGNIYSYLEDVGQAALGVGIVVAELTPVGAIILGGGLFAWETYEYIREHNP